MWLVNKNLDIIEESDPESYYTPPEGSLAALVTVAPGVLCIDLRTFLFIYKRQVILPIINSVTASGPRVFGITEAGELVSVSPRGDWRYSGRRVVRFYLRSYELELDDGKRVPVRDLPNFTGFVTKSGPDNPMPPLVLAHVLSLIATPDDVLSEASDTCPKCHREGEGKRVLFYPRHTDYCPRCDIVWRLKKPRVIPAYDAVRAKLLKLAFPTE